MRYAEMAAAMAIQRLVEEVEDSEEEGYTPGLTLRHLNRLRKLREQTALDKEEHLEMVRYMYSGFGNWTESAEVSAVDAEKSQKRISKAALRRLKDEKRRQEKNAAKARDRVQNE